MHQWIESSQPPVHNIPVLYIAKRLMGHVLWTRPDVLKRMVYIYINIISYLFIYLSIYLSIYWYNMYRNLPKKKTYIPEKKAYILPGQWPGKALPFNFDDQVKTYYNLTGTYLHLNLLVFNQLRSLFLAGSRQDLTGSELHHKVKSGNMMYHVHSTIYDSITCGQMSQ